jgi:hypothetical protein
MVNANLARKHYNDGYAKLFYARCEMRNGSHDAVILNSDYYTILKLPFELLNYESHKSTTAPVEQ